VRSVMRFPFQKLNHRPELKGGLLAEECGLLLKEFFRQKRKK
jgi:tRNA(adenine34) deaminase